MTNTLDAPSNLSAPDMGAFNNSRTQLRQQALSLGDIYLPRLQEKLRALLVELDLVDTHGLKTLTSMPSALQTDGLPDLIQTIKGLREASSEESAEAINELTRELKEEARKRISDVARQVGELDDAVSNFKGITLNDADPMILKLEEEIIPEKNRLEEEGKPLSDLQAQLAALNKLITEVESISLLDRLKPLVESLSALLEVDPKDPLAGSVKAGLEGIKNQLNLGAEFIKYSHLVSLRQTLQERLATLNERLRELQDQVAEQQGKIAQLKVFQGLGAHQQVYLREAGTLARVIADFAEQNSIDETVDVVEQVNRFVENAAAMTTYLHGLRREWQS